MLHWKIVLILVIFDHPSLRINTLKWFRILFISITVVCQKFVRLWFRIAVYGLSRGSGLGRLCSNHVGATAPMVEHYFPPPLHSPTTIGYFWIITLPVLSFMYLF